VRTDRNLGSSGIRHGDGPSITPSRLGFIVFAFLAAPLLLLIRFWRTNSWGYRHWLLTAFVTAYGSTIAIRYDSTGQGADGVRHLLLVYEHYVGMTFEQFIVDLWNTLTLQSSSHPGVRDPYKHIVSYFVGGVLQMPWLFFTLIAFVYGYFFSGSMLFIFRNYELSKVNYIVLAFAVLLLLVKNVEGVNTVRTWTGLWVLVYGTLRYYETKKLKYILLMFLSPFIHFAYWVMILPAIVVLIFGNRILVYSVLFVLSSFTTFLQPQVMTEALSSNEIGERSVESYYLEQRIEIEDVLRQSEGQRWYRVFQRIGVQKWGLNILIYTLLATGVYFSLMTPLQKSMFSTGLLTLTLGNSTWFLFALSNRSWIIGCVFVLSAFIMWRTNPRTKRFSLGEKAQYYRYGINLSLLFFAPYILYNLSTLLDYPSLFVFLMPFVVWLDPELNMSIKYALQVLLGLR